MTSTYFDELNLLILQVERNNSLACALERPVSEIYKSNWYFIVFNGFYLNHFTRFRLSLKSHRPEK